MGNDSRLDPKVVQNIHVGTWVPEVIESLTVLFAGHLITNCLLCSKMLTPFYSHDQRKLLAPKTTTLDKLLICLAPEPV